MDDLDLIRRVLEGDQGAYRILVVRYQRPIFKFLGTFTRLTNAIVEELAQETFLRAYKSLGSYDPAKGASFSTWLFTIAKNLALNEAARASTTREVGEGRDADDARQLQRACHGNLPETNVQVSGAAAGTPHEALERAERGSMLHRALRVLPQVFRSAVVLAYLKELSLDEIAAIERCSVGTVKSRIFRGKRLLAAALSETEG